MGDPSPATRISNKRASTIPPDEPIRSSKRLVVEPNALYVNLTKLGYEVLGVEAGDTVTVDVYIDRVTIRPDDD